MISILQVVKNLLVANQDLMNLAPGGIEVGGMNPDQQKLGCVEILEAGRARPERYVPMVNQRVQVNCYALSEYDVDQLVLHTEAVLDHKNRQIVTMPDDQRYLVHRTDVIAGPTNAVAEDDDLRVSVIFIEVLAGTQAIP